MRNVPLIAVLLMASANGLAAATENTIPVELPAKPFEHLALIATMPERQIILDAKTTSLSMGFNLQVTVRGPIAQADILAAIRSVRLSEYASDLKGPWSLHIEGDAQYAIVRVEPKWKCQDKFRDWLLSSETGSWTILATPLHLSDVAGCQPQPVTNAPSAP